MWSNRAEGTGNSAGLAQSLVLLPVGALIAWWALDEGGYDPVKWQPGALLLLPLAALVLSTRSLRRERQLTRRLRVCLGAFGLYTAWSYLSVTWAGDPGTALEGAHRCALYLAVMVVVGFSAPHPRVLRGAALVVAGLIGLVAVITLLRLSGAESPAGLFLNGRLYAPLGYFNADAAFWTTGALLGCVAASDRATSATLRPPLLGLAVLEVGLAILTGSRGWLFTLPLILLVVLIVVPGRVRFVLATLVVAASIVPALDTLLGPISAGGGRSLEEGTADTIAAVHEAVRPLALASLAALLVAIAWVAVDRQVILSARAGRVLSRVAASVAIIVSVGGTVALVSYEPHPRDRLERAWEDFKANDASKQSGVERFSSTGSGRYDLWRVATDIVASHPIIGVGQDNYAEAQIARRATDYEETRWVHSLPLRALAHTGIVGAVLLAVALGALAAGAIRIRERPDDRATAALALVPLVVWTVHGSVDWLWEYPVLSVIALGLAAGAGNAPVAKAPDVPTAPRRRWPGRLGVATAVSIAIAGVSAIGAAYVAHRDVRLAATGWPADPDGAFERLDQATALTPSAQPYLVEAVIALRLNDRKRARRAFGDAMRREPGDWYAPFQLGLLAAEDGDLREARALLAGAARRNPKDQVLREARRSIARGRPFTVADAERRFRERARGRFGGT